MRAARVADARTVTPGQTAMCSTAPRLANQVSVQPPQSQMRTGAVTVTLDIECLRS